MHMLLKYIVTCNVYVSNVGEYGTEQVVWRSVVMSRLGK